MKSFTLQSLAMRTLIAIFCLCLLWSCGSSDEQNTQGTVALDSVAIDTLAIQEEIDTVAAVAFETPILDSLTSSNDKALSALISLKEAIGNAPKIEGDEDIMAVLGKRDSLLGLLQYDILENFFYETLENMGEERYPVEEQFHKEIELLGLSPVFAEGMYVGLADGPLIQERIQEVASQELKFYLEFQLAYSNSLGTEYTYNNLEPEMEMVRIWYEMKQDFPKSAYLEKMQSAYDEAVMALTDVHFTGEDPSSLIVGGISTDYYPNGTHIDNQKKFTSEAAYQELPMVKAVKKIVENTSVFNDSKDTLNFLTVEVMSDYAQARGKAIAALNQGQDIPHVLNVLGKAGSEQHWVYRFYSSYSQADSVFKSNYEQLPSATWHQGIIKNGDIILLDQTIALAATATPDSTVVE